MTVADIGVDLSNYKLGWADEEDYVFKPRRGLDENLIREMSAMKEEPSWMLDFRLQSYKIYQRKPMPTWCGDLSGIHLDDIYYYIKPTEGKVDSWEELPDTIKTTYERLGIPEAEQKHLAGSVFQYESESVYSKYHEGLESQGVIFCDMDTAVRDHPDIVQKYLGTIIPAGDNTFAALNSSCWSGGSFIYVPPNIEVDIPLQAYFRMNAENMGQFERTLIITDEGSTINYIEGCSAPTYTTNSLHSAVVELVALPGSQINYITIQNWSTNVFNLVTKRGAAHAESRIVWTDGNLGALKTVKYPSVYLMGPKASGEVLSVAWAGRGQTQDTGGKMIHAAPETTSTIISKSISKDGGNATYRGLVRINEGMEKCKSHVQCDALLLDDISKSYTYPYSEIGTLDAEVTHEATVSKTSDDKLFYLMSRGLSEEQSMGMLVNGFIEPIVKTLPMEYAVEWSRLVELQMEGSIG